MAISLLYVLIQSCLRGVVGKDSKSGSETATAISGKRTERSKTSRKWKDVIGHMVLSGLEQKINLKISRKQRRWLRKSD